MRGQLIGSVIAAVFGAVYVVVNSGALPAGLGWTLRVLAMAAALVVAVMAIRATRATRALRPDTDAPRGSGRTVRSPFGRSYRVIVAIEVVALFAGTRLLSGPFDVPQAGVAWVSVVVGVHFFALAAVFRQRFFHLLGAAVTGCGVLALALALADTERAVTDLIGGVIPGLILLGFALWGVRRRATVKVAVGGPGRTQPTGSPR